MSLVYTIADLDVAFRYKWQRNGGSWWAKHWRRMVAEHGFPAPMPGFGDPRWSVAAVRAWIALRGGALPLTEQLKPRVHIETPPASLPFNLDALDKIA